MHLFEEFHKLIKRLAKMGDNHKAGYLNMLNNYLVHAALHLVIPPLLPPEAQWRIPQLPCLVPLVALHTFKWGDLEGVPPFDAATLAGLWPSWGSQIPAPPPDFSNVRFYHKAHLTRSILPDTKVCNSALSTKSVEFPCQLTGKVDSQGVPAVAQPFSPRGRDANPTKWSTEGDMYLCRAFFALRKKPEDIYVVAQKYLPFDATSQEAAQSPFTMRIRRQLGHQLVLLPLTFIFSPVPYWHFGSNGDEKDIIVRPFKFLQTC
jgi:hypothetical protein